MSVNALEAERFTFPCAAGTSTICVHESSGHLATIASQGGVHIYKLATGREVYKFQIPDWTHASCGLCFTPDGSCVIAALHHGQAFAFQIHDGAMKQRFAPPPSNKVTMDNYGTAIACDTDIVITGHMSRVDYRYKGSQLTVYNRTTAAFVCTTTLHQVSVTALHLMPDGTILASGPYSWRVFDRSLRRLTTVIHAEALSVLVDVWDRHVLVGHNFVARTPNHLQTFPTARSPRRQYAQMLQFKLVWCPPGGVWSSIGPESNYDACLTSGLQSHCHGEQLLIMRNSTSVAVLCLRPSALRFTWLCVVFAASVAHADP